jgi:hypothetical protein
MIVERKATIKIVRNMTIDREDMTGKRQRVMKNVLNVMTGDRNNITRASRDW